MNVTTTRLAAMMLAVLVCGPTPAAASAAPHRDASNEVAPVRATPLRGTLEGVHTSRTPLAPPFVRDRFDLQGQATHLGRFVVVIESTVNFAARPVTGVGTMTFTAANGDRIVADQTGASALVAPGRVLITESAVIDPERSTGRFAGARGTFTLQRLADAATGVGGRTSGSFAGTVSLQRSTPD